jgi:hypothetical protein
MDRAAIYFMSRPTLAKWQISSEKSKGTENSSIRGYSTLEFNDSCPVSCAKAACSCYRIIIMRMMVIDSTGTLKSLSV